jgi:NapC/NirT cytochrome c family, N-terminal region
MRNSYQAFIRGMSVNGFSKAGIVLVTSSVILFSIFEVLQLMGFIANAYMGLISYVGFPFIFLVGLFLIPIGWLVYSRSKKKSIKQLFREKFNEDDLKGSEFGTKLFRTITIFTIINVIIIGAASGRMLHYMDSAHFCGTACHSVMNPEWTTYQQSPHARVQCVECHVGEGVGALIDAKINGMWQMVSASFNLYERPIPTPVSNLRPARETCEKCHWPEKFLGNRVVNKVHYGFDEASTPKYTTLMMKVGSGGHGVEASGSHWHVDETNEVRYASIDDEREEMIWVEVVQEDGSYKRYSNSKISEDHSGEKNVRSMDCVDCHNRATHIYEEPDIAIDERMRIGLVSNELPFVKNTIHSAITSSYPSRKVGAIAIDQYIRNFYHRKYPEISLTNSTEIDKAVSVAVSIYERNIHPGMNISWGSYPSHLGHRDSEGCFRCHNPNMQDEEGLSISMDCTLCHSILAIDEDEPFKYIKVVDSDSLDSQSEMHRYFQQEFMESSKE